MDYRIGSMGAGAAGDYADIVIGKVAASGEGCRSISGDGFGAAEFGPTADETPPDEPRWFPGALAIMLNGPGRDLLQAAFCDAGWGLTIADTFAVALDPVADRFPIILYERELSERWREAISLISSQPARPYLILLSSSSDRNLWDELVRCGGFEILRTPVDRVAVQRAVKSGWSLWRNQQKLRIAAEACP